MRHFLFAICLLSPTGAAAWSFLPDPICTLHHTGSDGSDITITFDPGARLYALKVTRAADVWKDSASFGMTFSGGATLTIGTSRHVTQGPDLSVTDRGFGNVLDGLEFNTRAYAFTETQRVEISLSGAAKPVQDFRACTKAPQPGV